MTEINTKGSLCSGTGALDAATPGALQWVSENDKDAATILKREHPDVPNLGDLTAYDWSSREHVDLLTSGDPCQSMSAAGRQLASDDARFLWPDVMDVIRAVQPAHIFLENVQNLVSVPLVKGGERGGVLRLRLENLREAGYAVRWTVLGACAVGAPHHRHRWFLRARHVGAHAPEAERVINRCGAPRTGGRVLLPTPNARDGGGRGTPSVEHALRRVGNPERSINLEDAVVAYLLPTPTTADGSGGPGSPGRDGGLNPRTAVMLLPTPVARDADGRGEGDAEYWSRREAVRSNGKPLGAVVGLLPTPRATDIGTEGRRSSEGWRPQIGQAVGLLPTPRATDGVNGGPGQRGRKGDLAMGSAVQLEHWGKFAEAVTLWEQITGRPAPDPTVQAPKGGRRLNPELSEWMMGLRPGHVTSDMPRNAALRLAGNGVVQLQARTAWHILEPRV